MTGTWWEAAMLNVRDWPFLQTHEKVRRLTTTVVLLDLELCVVMLVQLIFLIKTQVTTFKKRNYYPLKVQGHRVFNVFIKLSLPLWICSVISVASRSCLVNIPARSGDQLLLVTLGRLTAWLSQSCLSTEIINLVAFFEIPDIFKQPHSRSILFRGLIFIVFHGW